MRRGTRVIERALQKEAHLTRAELGEAVRRSGIALDSMRLAHLVMHAELEAVICSGPRRGRHFTYALLAERAPGALRLSREEALAELTTRYFRSHGPATVRDFVWWSGLTTADAKRGLEIVKARREEVGGLVYWSVSQTRARAARGGLVHLLPIYDEYVVAYRDRHAVPHRPSGKAAAPRELAVTFQHALVSAGQVAGTWRTGRSSSAVLIDVHPLRRLTRGEQRELADAAERYSRFRGLTVELSLH